jgi:transposase
MQEIYSMNKKELLRLNILQQIDNKQVTQKKAAELLNISTRQVRNLMHAFKTDGAKGIISKKRGIMRNRKYEASVRSQALKLMVEKYENFGPTLVCEYLEKHDDMIISRETLRKWMIEAHMWVSKSRKKNIHPLRQRKEHFGEMLQGDGSHHDWFENNCPCTLVYFIDDATSRITAARFFEEETLDAYFEILKEHLLTFGVPWQLYTDRFSVFESRTKENLTQFRRALETIGIKWIGANSPQAKGRIERANRTLQDRLVKAMRLGQIKTMEAGNSFLERFIVEYNSKFSKKPMKSKDLHRPLDGKLDICRTLARYEERTLTKDLIFQYHNEHYKIVQAKLDYFPGDKIEIRKMKGGEIRAYIRDEEVEIRSVYANEEESKQKPLIYHPKRHYIPPPSHPWKRLYAREALF